MGEKGVVREVERPASGAYWPWNKLNRLRLPGRAGGRRTMHDSPISYCHFRRAMGLRWCTTLSKGMLSFDKRWGGKNVRGLAMEPTIRPKIVLEVDQFASPCRSF